MFEYHVGKEGRDGRIGGGLHPVLAATITDEIELVAVDSVAERDEPQVGIVALLEPPDVFFTRVRNLRVVGLGINIGETFAFLLHIGCRKIAGAGEAQD